MASITKRGKRWRAFIRRKGYETQSKTFPTKAEAQRWAATIEGTLEDQEGASADMLVTDIIDKYLDDLDAHKPPGRTKRSCLELIRRYLGDRRSSELTAEVLTDFFRERATHCAPATVQQDLIYMKGMLHTAKHIYGARLSLSALDSAATHCKRYNLVGKSNERDRRPTDKELKKILDHMEANNYYRSPMADIVRFAIDTTMRMSEILTIRWQDLDTVKRTVVIHARKHPSLKAMNAQTVPLLGDAFKIANAQPKKGERIFPYQAKAVGASFHRACVKLGIEDLHFHDMRHEGISRLFEKGYGVMEVAKVSGHRDINQLRRYVQLKAESLHDGPVKDRQGF